MLTASVLIIPEHCQNVSSDKKMYTELKKVHNAI